MLKSYKLGHFSPVLLATFFVIQLKMLQIEAKLSSARFARSTRKFFLHNRKSKAPFITIVGHHEEGSALTRSQILVGRSMDHLGVPVDDKDVRGFNPLFLHA